MKASLRPAVEEARQAALQVLWHNARGPFLGLPRTAGWGYPEPYTRDLLLGAFGFLVSEDEHLIQSLRAVLNRLARHQTPHGHIPGLVHDPNDLGASDTTPLFLIAVALFRRTTGEANFLARAADKALTWLAYQSPTDQGLVAQLPTSDWRDEQWVLGYGLYVNVLVYLAFRFHQHNEQARRFHRLINQTDQLDRRAHAVRHKGLRMPPPPRPYYALWAYKIYRSERFDLLGNCLAILSGVASPARARRIVTWVEAQCQSLRAAGQLRSELPPCLFPYIQPEDGDWLPRYALYNQPGHYHNGGVWPFVCGLYVAALVAARQFRLAEQKLQALTDLVRPARNPALAYGFNEWFQAQTGAPSGQDWQSWSATLYLYAATAVEHKQTPFFDEIRYLTQ